MQWHCNFFKKPKKIPSFSACSEKLLQLLSTCSLRKALLITTPRPLTTKAVLRALASESGAVRNAEKENYWLSYSSIVLSRTWASES